MIRKFVFTFVILLLAWITFTVSIAKEELIVGFIASLIVTIIVFRNFLKKDMLSKSNPVRWAYFIMFNLVVIEREIIAHIKLIFIILSPRLKIKPEMLWVESELKNDNGLTMLANSITITPGTLTVDVKDSKLLVHCIDKTERKKILGLPERLLKGVVE